MYTTTLKLFSQWLRHTIKTLWLEPSLSFLMTRPPFIQHRPFFHVLLIEQFIFLPILAFLNTPQ